MTSARVPETSVYSHNITQNGNGSDDSEPWPQRHVIRRPPGWQREGSVSTGQCDYQDNTNDVEYDPSLVIPCGYRLIPEEERLATLERLRQKLAELEDRYARLPLRFETEGHRRQQRLVREKLA